MTMSLADRLLHARKESGFADTKPAADRAGITPSALYQLENGKTKSLHGATAVQLAKVYPRFRIEWLIAGDGPMHVQDGLDRVHVSTGDTPPGYVRLPLLSMEGEMGIGAVNEEPPEVVQFLEVAEWWARQNLPHRLDRIRVITARGDSMAGVINHGDVVFVDAESAFYDGEGIYVFNWQGRALIKRLAPNLRTGQLQILSANSHAYPPEDVAPGEIDQLHIAGRVLAWLTLKRF